MPRLDTERQKTLEPKRMDTAITSIEKLGIKIDFKSTVVVEFKWKDAKVSFFPYSGWHSGKTITDGRGLGKLLKQLQ